jgi:hypothetical protein
MDKNTCIADDVTASSGETHSVRVVIDEQREIERALYHVKATGTSPRFGPCRRHPCP